MNEFMTIAILSAAGIVCCIYILHFGLTEKKSREGKAE